MGGEGKEGEKSGDGKGFTILEKRPPPRHQITAGLRAWTHDRNDRLSYINYKCPDTSVRISGMGPKCPGSERDWFQKAFLEIFLY